MSIASALGSFMSSPVGQGVSTIGRIVGPAARTLGSSGLAAAFGSNNPAVREIYYQANRPYPNLVADPNDLISIYHAGQIEYAELARQVRMFGIDLSADDAQAEAWRRIVQHHRPSFELDTYKKWYRQGRLNADGLARQVAHQGITEPWHAALYLNDYEMLPEPVIRYQYILGHISYARARELLQQLGFRQVDADEIIAAWTVTLSPHDAIQLRHRGIITPVELDNYLKQSGISRAEDRDRVRMLANLVPTPSDAILMAVHDVFEPDLVGRDLAITEYGQQRGLKQLFRASGIGQVFIEGISPETNDQVDVGLLYWLAHYRHVSPQQVYEMFHRLRPDRVDKWKLPGQSQAEVEAMVTSLDTVRKLLKLDDYNPFWRDRLAAIAYRPIGRIDIRRMYKFGVFGETQGTNGFQTVNGNRIPIGSAEKEVTAAYQDMGYAPPDAVHMAYFTAASTQDSSLTRIRTTMKSVVCQALEAGVGTTQSNLQRLLDVGIPQLEAEAIIQSCEIRREINKVKRAVKLIRRAYLGGRITLETVTASLNTIGVSQIAITRYIEEWTLELSTRAKEPQASQLCEWYGSGLLTGQDFNQRLLRLGWAQADATRIINHCLAGIIAKSKKENERAANIAKRAAKEKLSEERYALRRFLSGRQDQYIVQWFKEGTITLEDVRQTLVLRGWSKADVERFICTLTGDTEPCKAEEEKEEDEVEPTS